MKDQLKFLSGKVSAQYQWQLPDEATLLRAKKQLEKLYPVDQSRIYVDEETNSIYVESDVLLNHRSNEDPSFSPAIDLASSLLSSILTLGAEDGGS